jgi:hypothetical protein
MRTYDNEGRDVYYLAAAEEELLLDTSLLIPL